MRPVWKLGLSLTVAFATLAALVVTAFAAVGAGISPVAASAPSAEQQYNRRITICHRSGRRLKRSKYRTIRIPPRALRGHVRHGDGIGACPRARFTICHKVKKRGKTVRLRTMRVRGWKAHRKHMRHGDKIRACPKPKKKKKR
jgi:hypothetical protein